MNAVEQMTVISVVASVVSALAAIVAIYFSHRAEKFTQRGLELEKHSLDYQKTIKVYEIKEKYMQEVLSIRRDFPKNINTPLSMCSELEKNALRRYWETVFSEYHTCQGNIPEIQSLWDNEYKIHVRRALKWKSFDESLIELISHIEKNPLNTALTRELESLRKQ